MWLLYVDESGEPGDADDHFVLGAMAVKATHVATIQRDVDAILVKHLGVDRGFVELRATAVRGGKKAWRRVPKIRRAAVLDDVINMVSTRCGGHSSEAPVLFGVVHTPGAVPQADRVERSFEELFLKFTQMLVRRGEGEVGLAVADESRYESTLQPVVNRWRTRGTRFARLTRLVEVPLFVDSQATRLVQLADLVAHALYLAYERNDTALLDPLIDSFDRVAGTYHGLTHLSPDHRRCGCRACTSRRD